MAEAGFDDATPAPVLAADGSPLQASLRRAERSQRLRAFALVAPLLLFVLLTFIAPIGDMLYRSVNNDVVADTLPQTVVALAEWSPEGSALPGEAVYAALYADLKIAVAARRHTVLGGRLNYEQTGIASLFRKTGRRIKRMDEQAPLTAQFTAVDKKWADVQTWRTIHQFSPRLTDGYLLAAIDLQRTHEGVVAQPADKQIYLKLFWRTLYLSVAITLSCLLLGYPVAWLLATLRIGTANLLLILVLLPFWTSLLVRTSAWKVLLQQQGVINDTLVWLGWVEDAQRLEMINNQTGTLIAMTHILLPFMILPLYSVMKSIPPSYVRAAKSLGATDWTAFWRVYFPQSVPGIGAGAILCFILAIGYYITPELVGGTQGTFVSNRIAYHLSSSLNWGLAAALGVLMLAGVLVLYWLYDRIVGIDNVKLG